MNFSQLSWCQICHGRQPCPANMQRHQDLLHEIFGHSAIANEHPRKL
jgi:hypothetical protein